MSDRLTLIHNPLVGKIDTATLALYAGCAALTLMGLFIAYRIGYLSAILDAVDLFDDKAHPTNAHTCNDAE